jgi:uncharacterized protein YfaS (alpha-2-macroglobulin family)
VKGAVRANYFFGKPVDGAEISVKASSTDVTVFEVASAQGKTTHEGSYEFDLKLPAYINPEIITDKDGVASITIPLADSITTWRMAMMASTPRGVLGSGTSSLKDFQDFFVDLDLPVTLNQGDRVSIPVAVYNYSGAPGDVNLQLKDDDWFSLVNDVAEKNLTVESARVGGSHGHRGAGNRNDSQRPRAEPGF